MTYEEKVRWLRRYQDSLRREQELAEEVEQLRARACKITTALTGMPGGTNGGQRLPLVVEQIVETQQKLQDQVNQCEVLRNEIVDAIDKIENNLDQEILKRKYILDQKWERISEIEHLDVRWLRRRHKKAIERLYI